MYVRATYTERVSYKYVRTLREREKYTEREKRKTKHQKASFDTPRIRSPFSAPSADAKSGDGGANRDKGRDRAMSRNGTVTGGTTSGAATMIVGAEASASATGTIGAIIGTTITGATMTRATDATKGSSAQRSPGGTADERCARTRRTSVQ